MIQVEEIVNSIYMSKTYIIYKDGFNYAWLIDIGDINPVMAFLANNKLRIKGVFLTHAHYDHFYGLPDLISLYPHCIVYVSWFTKIALASDKMNLSRYHEIPLMYEGDNIEVINDGDKLLLFEGESPMEFYVTPGHNPGCLTMVVGNMVFTGDAFIPELGVNTKFPKSDKEQAKQSLERILKLAEGRRVLSGHKIMNKV